MPRYFNRRSGQLVNAVQFTGPGSVQKITDELGCDVYHEPKSPILYADGVSVHRGQYAVAAMCAVMAMDQSIFDARFKMRIEEGDLLS